ncbi:MAG TPA: BON domain-containing protein [Candidatus Binatia bacterium]|nr:BON domain-containing protein [Candidatus Binatia bacterium]
MKSKLWQAFLVASISALAVPAFVQSQTAGGGTSPGSGMSSGATGSSRTMEDPSSPSGSASRETMPSTPGSSAGMAAATDQAKSETDRTLNQNIHLALNADSALSASAKNVHFNTDNGKVTLKGTVPTEKDKKDIEAKVEKMTGVKDVDNQLQIAPATTTSSAAGSTGSMGAPGGAESRSGVMGSRGGAESSGSSAMGSRSSSAER